MAINIWYIIAAIVCALGFWVHISLGSREIDNVIFASSININIRTISRIVWHSVSLILIISSMWLCYGAFKPISRDLAYFIAAYLAGFCGLFLYFSYVHLGNPIKFPHPFVFGLMAIFVLIGSK